jgi:pimeloyl-ACP methyl ester carboxylesterase
VAAGDLGVHYLELGSGPPLLLLHGGTGTANISWDIPFATLTGRWRIIAPDTRVGKISERHHRLFMKLRLRDRSQAVVAAYQNGLVKPGEEPPAHLTQEAVYDALCAGVSGCSCGRTPTRTRRLTQNLTHNSGFADLAL